MLALGHDLWGAVNKLRIRHEGFIWLYPIKNISLSSEL